MKIMKDTELQRLLHMECETVMDVNYTILLFLNCTKDDSFILRYSKNSCISGKLHKFKYIKQFVQFERISLGYLAVHRL